MAKKEYIQANKDWLAAKAAEEGVQPLPKGIYYKVLTKGADDGKHPTPRSIVTAHYSGWTINGKKFDSSRGGAPIAFRLSDLIEGWIIAMQPCSRCALAISGKFTSLPKWDMASSHNPVFPAVRP